MVSIHSHLAKGRVESLLQALGFFPLSEIKKVWNGVNSTLWQFILSLAHKSSCGNLADIRLLAKRQPSAAFPRDISSCANVNWNCYIVP